MKFFLLICCFFHFFSYVCPTQLEDVKKLFWILKYFTSEFTRMCLVRSPGQGGKFCIHQLHVNISSLRVHRSSHCPLLLYLLFSCLVWIKLNIFLPTDFLSTLSFFCLSWVNWPSAFSIFLFLRAIGLQNAQLFF